MENEILSIHLEEDLTEIAALIWNYMDNKYISQMKAKLEGYRHDCEQTLCKEGQLIKAVMPFVPQESKLLQFVLDMIIYNDMIERTLSENRQLEKLYRDDNSERQQLKKLVYKLILFKLVTAIEKGSMDKV